MSDKNHNSQRATAGQISIGGTISQSYQFFTSHFIDFLKLGSLPFFGWVLVEFICDYMFLKHQIVYDSSIPLAIISATFALLWYRLFLMGTEYATYAQLFEHVFSPGIFNLNNLLKSIMRIVLTTIILFVPTLMLSISIMIYQFSQGMLLDDEAIRDIAVKSTTLIVLLFSPILIRLSFYTVGIALGRRSMSLRAVWKKTSGNTLTLWLLILRAFLPISLYSYCVTWMLGELIEKFSISFLWASLCVSIPTAFFTLMMLAIVVAVNGEAFKVLFGVRVASRP